MATSNIKANHDEEFQQDGNFYDNNWNSASWLAVILEVAILTELLS